MRVGGSGQIFRRINNFINYRIAATLQLLCFFFIAVFAFPPHQYSPGRGPAGTTADLPKDVPGQKHHLSQAELINHVIPSLAPSMQTEARERLIGNLASLLSG